MKSLNKEDQRPTLITGNLREVMALDKWVNEHEPFYKDNAEPMLIETDQIPTEKLNKIKEIMQVASAMQGYCSRAFVKSIDGDFHIYFYIMIGANGWGEAIDDLIQVTTLVERLKRYTRYVSFIQAERDCADDVSYWSMTFTI